MRHWIGKVWYKSNKLITWKPCSFLHCYAFCWLSRHRHQCRKLTTDQPPNIATMPSPTSATRDPLARKVSATHLIVPGKLKWFATSTGSLSDTSTYFQIINRSHQSQTIRIGVSQISRSNRQTSLNGASFSWFQHRFFFPTQWEIPLWELTFSPLWSWHHVLINEFILELSRSCLTCPFDHHPTPAPLTR